MYKINENVLKAFESDNREIAVRCTFNDNFIIDGEYIRKVEITDVISGDTTLSLGNTCSNQLKLDMYLPDDFVGLGNAKINVELGIVLEETIQYVPVGIFYVDSFKTNSDFKSVSVIAYDAMQKISELGDAYKCKISANNSYVSPIDVINDIALQAGLLVSGSSEYVNTDNFLNRNDIANVVVSPRAMLGYMAALLGGNAKIDRNGNVTVKKLDNTEYKISGDTQFMNGLTKNITAELFPTYLTSGTQGEDGTNQVITVGSGTFGFNFSNPYFYKYKSVADRVLSLYKDNISFITGSVNYRCNPALESGDIVSVEDKLGNYYNFLIKSQTITINGGLKAVLNCDIDTTSNAQFISVPRNRTVSQSFSDFDRMYQSIISKLTGNQGGYVKFVYDEYGKMRAIAIPESDIDARWDNESGTVISEENVPMWVWSNGGLSYSPDGGWTYNVAMNSAGQIFANYLQSPLGYIGNWMITKEKIFQRVKDGTTTYEFNLKSDSDISPNKKAVYCNIFSNNRNSDSDDADTYKTENFYIRRNGEVMFKSGAIAGWNIDENGFYKDDGDYRAYIGSPDSSKRWVFSVQKKETDGEYYGKFRVNAEGETYIGNNLILATSIVDDDGDEIVSPYRDGSFVFGYGSYNKNYRTFLEGGALYLKYRGDKGASLQIQENNATIFTVDNRSSSFDVGTGKRNTICSAGGFVLSANGGNNAMYLHASRIGLYGNTVLSNDTTIKGDLTINVHSTSGLAPLYVNSSGVISPTSSSERYKENITEELEDWLNPERLYDLPVVQYDYKNEFKDIELVTGTQIGITADNVHEHYPNACIYNEKGEPESWQDRIMIPAMLKLIQEQKKEIDSLNERLTLLENSIKNRAD